MDSARWVQVKAAPGCVRHDMANGSVKLVDPSGDEELTWHCQTAGSRMAAERIRDFRPGRGLNLWRLITGRYVITPKQFPDHRDARGDCRETPHRWDGKHGHVRESARFDKPGEFGGIR